MAGEVSGSTRGKPRGRGVETAEAPWRKGVSGAVGRVARVLPEIFSVRNGQMQLEADFEEDRVRTDGLGRTGVRGAQEQTWPAATCCRRVLAGLIR